MEGFLYTPPLKGKREYNRKLWAAFHEAGHAIMGCKYNCPPKYSKIILENGKWSGETDNTVASKGYKIEMQVVCAGFYSEAKYSGVYNYLGVAFGPNPDRHHLMTLNSFESDLTDEIIIKYQKEIVDYFDLPEIWNKVEKLAGALYKKEELTRKEILELVS